MAVTLGKDNFLVQWSNNKLFFEWKIKESNMVSGPNRFVYISPTFAAGSSVYLTGTVKSFYIMINKFSFDNFRSKKLTLQYNDAKDPCKHSYKIRLFSNRNSAFIPPDQTFCHCPDLNLKLLRKFPAVVRFAINCVESWNEIFSRRSFLPSESKSTPKCFLQLASDLKKVFDQSINTDVVLKVGKKSIKAHKMILQARSSVFLKMFDHSTSEASENVVNITDISPEAMKKFIGYLYTGTMEECSFEETLQMYYAADKYEVLSLRENCVPELLKNLNVKNACSLFALASRHGDEDLKEAVVKFASSNFVAVVDTESFEELSKDDMKTFTRLCSGAKKMRYC